MRACEACRCPVCRARASRCPSCPNALSEPGTRMALCCLPGCPCLGEATRSCTRCGSSFLLCRGHRLRAIQCPWALAGRPCLAEVPCHPCGYVGCQLVLCEHVYYLTHHYQPWCAEPAVVHPSYFYQGAHPYVCAPARKLRVDSSLKERAGSQELQEQPCAETSEPAADDVIRV